MLFYHPCSAIFNPCNNSTFIPSSQMRKLRMRDINNICNIRGRPQIHRIPKPWLLDTDLYYPRNRSGCVALGKKVSIHSSVLEELPPSLFPILYPISILKSHCSHLPLHLILTQPIIRKLFSPLFPWGAGHSITELINHLSHSNFLQSVITLECWTTENANPRPKFSGSRCQKR